MRTMRAARFILITGLMAAVPVAAAEAYNPSDFPPLGWNLFFTELLRSIDVIGFILLAIFLILLGMCIDLFNHLRIGKLIPESLLSDVQEDMANGEYEKSLELSEKSSSLIGAIFAAALAKSDYSFDRMEDAMRAEVKIQGLVWRQWVGQFRTLAFAGFLLGFIGMVIELMRFLSDMVGRSNVTLALASSFEARQLLYGALFSLLMGAVMALVSLLAFTVAQSKLEKILLEAERLGEELLDPFRPLPLAQEE